MFLFHWKYIEFDFSPLKKVSLYNFSSNANTISFFIKDVRTGRK